MGDVTDRISETQANSKLIDDIDLLFLMLADAKHQNAIYLPGPYWEGKTKSAIFEIINRGIMDFRGNSSQIANSYADNIFMDARESYNHGLKRRITKFFTCRFPFRRIFDSQISLTKNYANSYIECIQKILLMKERTGALLEEYFIPDSILGDCIFKARIEGRDYSVHYLNLLEQHDNIAKHINFKGAESIFEIGGGFGANIHLLLSNYKNIKKVLYLDIPPNLYVGTQYLKAFYGSSVYDYRDLRKRERINFSNNDELEIFCIAPWQIENFGSSVDIFFNSHSFVEMPENVVQNYASKINEFHNSDKTAIALTTYDQFDLNSTFHPNKLPHYFKGRKFHNFEKESLVDSKRKNIYFVSSGDLSPY